MRETLILHLPEDADGTYHWRIQGIGATAMAEQVGSGALADVLSAANALDQPRVVVLAPTEKIVLTHVDLPVRQQSKLLLAVPYALEDKLAQDVDELHFSLGARQSDGSTPVAAVSIEQMQAWLDPLLEAGLQVELLIPDVLALPYTPGQTTLQISAEGRCLVRTGAVSGFCVPSDLLEFSLPSETVAGLCVLRTAESPAAPVGRQISQSHTVENTLDALRHWSDASQRINLRQGTFAPRKASDQWLRATRWPAAMAASWVLLASGLMALENHQLQQEAEQLRERTQQSFSQAFPEITRIVDLRIQAEQQLARLRNGGDSGGFLLLLSQSAPALVKTPDLKLDGLQFRDGSLYLSLSGSDLQALERLRAEFALLTMLKLDVQSAQAGSDGVQIRLKVDQA